ncbi:MAG: hypothetical protein IT204_16500 [Fimbriimonadaceae bacterium]|nr:hypothetical protein [Fimbriimonadaceae bacterium]
MTGIWLLAALLLAPQVSGPSLLSNGGFEAATGWSGSAPADWGDCAGSFQRVATQPQSGGWCGEVRGVRLRYMVAAERLALAPEQAYLLRGWVRTALGGGESAYLAASFSKGGKFTHVSSSRRLTGGQPWTRLELLLPVTNRQGADSVLLSFRVESGSGAGVAWVDAVEWLPVMLPPPPSRVAQEQARQRQLVRTFLVEREFWTDRLAALQQRRRDLDALLAGDAATWQRQEPAPRSRSALEAAVPRDWALLQPRLGQLAALPRLKAACLAELEATLQRKRQLDATPEQRRAWLRAQLPAPRPALPPAPPRPLDAAVAAALAANPTPSSGSLGEVRTRTGWTPTAWLRCEVAVTAASPGLELYSALCEPGGQPIWWESVPLTAAKMPLAAKELPVSAWTPEQPVLYDWIVALRRADRVTDLHRAKVAFRDLAVTAGDLSGTLRHAWGWAAEDSSYRLNGQPWFPRGTVLNDLSRHLEPSVALLRELGLEFQRNYGYQTGNISGRLGDLFRQHGLLLLAGLGPSYQAVGTFESREAGFAEFRQDVRGDRALVNDPAVLALQVGNEAELSVWGADLGSSYGEDLWQPFEEAIAVVREEADPAVPLSYVRAGGPKTVAPVPAEDYSGVNQYAGRYWGTRRTISADLGGLGFHAAAAGKPFGVTEWFGPKYSWATSGISGVDEAGAARYLVDYQQALERAPGGVLSTQFVLNWVVTPVEDLTTVPYAEGRKVREGWSWSLQQGTPWYPHVFPNLLTETPARRHLRGLNSPLKDLVETPGRLLVSGPPADAATAAGWLRGLGRSVEVVPLQQLPQPAEARASVLLLAPDRARSDWLLEGELDRLPAPGQYVLRRRLLPADPDRLMVILTGDAAGYAAGLERLRGDVAGLTEAYAQRASCRRLLALVDSDNAAFERYVTDTAMRGWFLARDDLRQRLEPAELLTSDGALQPAFADLALLLVTVKRALEPAELTALRTLAQRGVEVVWSAGTLAVNPLPGVSLGAPQDLTGAVPVASWAQQPLLVRDLGQVRGEALTAFGGWPADSATYRAATTARTVQAAGEAAAAAAGQPVVVRQPLGDGAFWYCGADLVALADALTRTTQRGVNHGLYDRDTACGLERWFRLLTNAGARRATPRPAARPRLRCDVQLDHLVLPAGQPLGATVVVRNQDGALTDATVRGAVLAPSGSNYGSSPRSWRPLQRQGPGRYRLDVPAGELPPAAAVSVLDSRLLGVWISAEAAGHVGDWTVASLAGARVDGEAERLARLVEELQQGLVRLPWGVNDEQQYIEVQGHLTVRPPLRAGVAAQLGLSIRQIESDEGNDAMEEVELLLQPPTGPPIVLPVAPGKVLCSPKQATVKAAPATALVVTSEQPFTVQVPWPQPTAGSWRVGLRYLYTDDYRPTIRRVPRTDWLPAPTLEVQ